MPHPAYSPDLLAPSDYHLLRSLEHYLLEKTFVNTQYLKNQFNIYFESKPLTFFGDGIHSLIAH